MLRLHSTNCLTFLCLASWLTFSAVSAHASDLQKELRMKNQTIDYIMDGEAVMLKAGSHEFLSIYTEADTQPARGAVIIMHGRGYHPDWPELVNPLRVGLTEHGWNTLSIQVPVLDNEASFYDYLDIVPEAFPRIDSAVEFLQQNTIQNIVLLAHSCGVHMAVPWLQKNPGKGVDAFIGVGMGSTDIGQPMPEEFPLEQIKIPILDIRGEEDYPAVIRHAPRRWARIQKAGNPHSQQRVVEKSDHYFTARGDALLAEVIDWLKQL